MSGENCESSGCLDTCRMTEAWNGRRLTPKTSCEGKNCVAQKYIAAVAPCRPTVEGCSQPCQRELNACAVLRLLRRRIASTEAMRSNHQHAQPRANDQMPRHRRDRPLLRNHMWSKAGRPLQKSAVTIARECRNDLLIAFYGGNGVFEALTIE